MLNRYWLGVDSLQSIPSQHHFDATSFRHNVSFLKIVDLELDTDADEYGCLRKRKVSATAAVPKKSATSEIEDYLCDSLSGGTFQG